MELQCRELVKQFGEEEINRRCGDLNVCEGCKKLSGIDRKRVRLGNLVRRIEEKLEEEEIIYDRK